MPLVEVLVELEYNGIEIDAGRLAALEPQVRRSDEALEREIYELAGREFNIGSPKQLGRVLFEEHKLPMHQDAPRPAAAPTPTCWRNWPGCIRCRPRSSSTGSTPS